MSDDPKSCCDKWAEETAGGYAPGGARFAQIEQTEDGLWAINGCCGGGCFVIHDVRFCPFCGACVASGGGAEKG